MALKIECDRCHKPIADTDEVFRRGVAIERDYCADCVLDIDAMLDDVDALHDDIVGKWDKGLAKIRKTYSVKGGLIPDVESF